jgi:hypothetical protein
MRPAAAMEMVHDDDDDGPIGPARKTETPPEFARWQKAIMPPLARPTGYDDLALSMDNNEESQVNNGTIRVKAGKNH